MAPTINYYLWRPVLVDPPLCTGMDLEVVTLSQLVDFHEALDLKAAMVERARWG